MQSQKIGKSDLVAGRLSYGCMRIAGTWSPDEITAEKKKAGKAAVIAAYEAGYTLFDHADIYCRNQCEAIFGEVLRDAPGMRKDVLIATKCGIRFPGDPEPVSPHRYDFSKQHILRSCENSLRHLGVETIDIYQLHRPDLLMDPLEVADAFQVLAKDGKVRFFGVSNFLPSFVSALAAALPFPLIVNQVEIHLGRLDPFYDGTLDQCLERDLTPLSWSPLGGGFLGDGGVVSAENDRKPTLDKLLQTLDTVAEELGETRTVTALAWLLKHPSKIVPIVGSINPERIRNATRADRVSMTREQWYRLLVAPRGKPLL